MSKERIRAHCPRCRHLQVFRRDGINHPLHLLLTVITLGLWGISWIALAIGHRHRPYYCDQCNSHIYR